VYYVHCTDGHLEDVGADIDLNVGTWGDGTSPADRAKVSMVHKETEGQAELMVIDADPEPTLAATALARAEVIGTPLVAYVFRLTNAICEQDSRFY
jgi:hypothetical protein